MKLSKIILAICLFFSLNSCKIAVYESNIGQSISTEIDLSEANFNVLGSFTGSSSVKKTSLSVRGQEGIVSLAKKDLLENAKKAGIELKGARALINVSTDIVENKTRINCTISAEIIEFVK